MTNSGRTADAAKAEHQLKALYLFNFLQFVEWPPSAHPAKTSPLVIGIVGADPFGVILDSTIEGEKVEGRSLEVRRLKAGEEATGCHLVFFAAGTQTTASETLQQIRGRPVLTVGESPGFAQRGGVINFTMVGAKVQFEINRTAESRQGIKISSKLLRLARMVDEKPEGPAR